MVTYFHPQVFPVLGQFHNVSAEGISEDCSFDFSISFLQKYLYKFIKSI